MNPIDEAIRRLTDRVRTLEVWTARIRSTNELGGVPVAGTPDDGDVLVYDDYTGTWGPGPGSVVSDIVDLPTAETDTDLRLAPDGAGGVEWAAGAGGEITHSYIGYDTIGGSSEGWGTTNALLKQVTLASAGVLLTIDFYTQQAADSVYQTPTCGVWADASGVAGIQLFAGGGATGAYYGGPAGTYPARWVSVACGLYLPAGTYWIGGESGTGCAIFYDGSGSDRTWTFSAGTAYVDGARWTQSDTTKKYSIRGSLIQ